LNDRRTKKISVKPIAPMMTLHKELHTSRWSKTNTMHWRLTMWSRVFEESACHAVLSYLRGFWLHARTLSLIKSFSYC